jgi:hypothetical protein
MVRILYNKSCFVHFSGLQRIRQPFNILPTACGEISPMRTATKRLIFAGSTRPVKRDPAWQDGFKSFSDKVMGLLSASPRRLGRPALAKPWLLLQP